MPVLGSPARRVRCPRQTDSEWRIVSRKAVPHKEKPKACYTCGGPHLARDCPTESEWSKKCYRCGGPHLARNCSLPYKVDKMVSSGERRLEQDRKEARNDSLKPGDWLCPSCGDHQFAKNSKCRMCGAAKPGAGCGKSLEECSDIVSCSIAEDDETVPKNEQPVASLTQPVSSPKQTVTLPRSPVASPKQPLALTKQAVVPPLQHLASAVVEPDAEQMTTMPVSSGLCKPSWADIADEADDHYEPCRRKAPSDSTSVGVSDASSQLDDTPSEDWMLSGNQTDVAWLPVWNPVYPMNQVVMCGSIWPEMWWPTYSQDSPQPMRQCPDGHQLVHGVISSSESFICDGCASIVQGNDHVMECAACNWGLCKKCCFVEATILRPGDHAKSLCEEPSWTPCTQPIGEEEIVVETSPICQVAVDYDGFTAWPFTAGLEDLEAGDSSPTGAFETPMDQIEQVLNYLGA